MIDMTAMDSRNRFANTLKELAARKTLEKITTEEIVKAAGLSRQTFFLGQVRSGLLVLPAGHDPGHSGVRRCED